MIKAGRRSKVVCFTGWQSLPHITCEICACLLKHPRAYPGLHRDAVLVSQMRKEAQDPGMTREAAIIRSYRFDPLAALSVLKFISEKLPS